MNVSKNVQLGIKDATYTLKNESEKVENREFERQTTQQTPTQAIEQIPRQEKSKRNETEVSSSPAKMIPELLQSPENELKLKSARCSKSKTNINKSHAPLVTRENIQPQTEFDDNETILAKITSSQRGICISLDTLM